MENKKKQELARKQKELIAPILMGLILFGSLGYLIHYCSGALKKNEMSLSDLKRKAKAISRMQDLTVREKDLLKVFPNIQKKNDIIEEIAGWARKEGLEVAEITPKETSLSGTNFKQLVLTLNGTGTYLSLMRFLKRIEASPYFVLASSLQLNGYELKGWSRYRSRSPRQADTKMDRGFKVNVDVFLLQ